MMTFDIHRQSIAQFAVHIRHWMRVFLGVVAVAGSAAADEVLISPAPAKESADQALARFGRIEAGTKFCTPSFWAWELELAVLRRDRELAGRIAERLFELQKPGGDWGLGTDWTLGEFDFKRPLAADAESWEVAEVANALLDYAEAFDEQRARERVQKAAAWLKRSIRRVDGRPYLPHMPDCNNLMQPHSVINTALLFHRLPKYRTLSKELLEAGMDMKFQRIITTRGKKKLDPPIVGHEINDYEKLQIGFYLLRMGDRRGREIVDRYRKREDFNHPRGAYYAVLAHAVLGDWKQARTFARLVSDFKPYKGYEYALRDIVTYVNNLPPGQEPARPGRASAAAFRVRQGPDWKLVNPKADWQPRDSCGEFVFDNHLWLLGGWVAVKSPNPRDVWKSADGVKWTRVVETAPWEYSDLSVALVYHNRMWLMGGRKVPGAQNSNAVWSSKNGADWTLVSEHAGWSPRVSASFAVFKDRMWVLGGSEHFYEEDEKTLHNDVWSSTDGKTWKLEVEHAPWPPRAHARAIVFNNRLWIMGGGPWYPKARPMNDVWSSADGVHWEQVTESAPWKPRIWFSTVVYRDRLWLFGGWCEETDNFGDVWYTKNGRDWTQVKSNVMWKSRHELSAWVFKDRIWIAAGHARPLSNEVWTLHIPEDWFKDEP